MGVAAGGREVDGLWAALTVVPRLEKQRAKAKQSRTGKKKPKKKTKKQLWIERQSNVKGLLKQKAPRFLYGGVWSPCVCVVQSSYQARAVPDFSA